MGMLFRCFGGLHRNLRSAEDDGGMPVGPSFVSYGGARFGTNRIVDRTLRSLVGATLELILTCAISILFAAHPALSASQEREERLQRAIDELLDGRPLPAFTDASETVEVDPQSAVALAVLGLYQLKCGEWEKAESCFNEATAIDSLSPEAHLGLGLIAASKMRYRDAIPLLRQPTSSQLFPGAAYRALALSLERLNLHQEASRAMREACKYADELRADELAKARAFADIFAAYDGRSLCRIPESFRSTSVDIAYLQDHITLSMIPLESAGSRCAMFPSWYARITRSSPPG
jgi:tetratricopeptide (TPR) repeat protein